MNFLKTLSIILLFSQISLASGPSDIDVVSSGSGYGVEETEAAALELARKMAARTAEKISEEELNLPDEDGYIPVGEDARTCEPDSVVSSQSECKKQSNDMFFCEYKAQFKCSQTSWHESQ